MKHYRTHSLVLAGMIGLSTASPSARAATIDFQDGTDGSPVGNFYASLGVLFDNSRWGFLGLSPNMGIYSISGGFQPTAATALIATFTTPVSFVSIAGIDAGENGIRIDAYDAQSGGNLVGFDQAFGVGLGGADPLTISVTAPSIWRVAIYQPQNIIGDSVGFDTLIFTPVPEPSLRSLWIVAGIAGLAAGRRWMRRTPRWTRQG